MTEPTNPRILAFKSFLDRHNTSAHKVSLKAKIASSALYNFIRGESQYLAQPTVEAIARAYNTTIGDVVGHDKGELSLAPIPIRGSAEPGVWRKMSDISEVKDYTYWPVDNKFKGSAFGLRVSGPAMNIAYPPGSVLICVEMAHFDRPLKNKDRVIVQQGGPEETYETTVKEYIENAGKIWLWPRSDHPMHQQPVEYKQNNPNLKIYAVVIGSITIEDAGEH